MINAEGKPYRQLILESALDLTIGDRNKSYGDPHENLTVFANLVGAYLGIKIDSVDASVIMNLAKVSRIKVNKFHNDNYVDGAAYMAIAGECSRRIPDERAKEDSPLKILHDFPMPDDFTHIPQAVKDNLDLS